MMVFEHLMSKRSTFVIESHYYKELIPAVYQSIPIEKKIV